MWMSVFSKQTKSPLRHCLCWINELISILATVQWGLTHYLIFKASWCSYESWENITFNLKKITNRLALSYSLSMAVILPMASISMPRFFNVWAARLASSWDLPSVRRITSFSASSRAPASGFKFCSRTWVSARPGEEQRWIMCYSLADNPPTPLLFSLPPVALVPMRFILWERLPPLQPHRSLSRALEDGVTCKSVATFVPQTPHGLQHLVPCGVSAQVPFCAGVTAVLGQPWGRQEHQHHAS